MLQVRRRVTGDKASRPQSEVINQMLIEKFKVRNTLFNYGMLINFECN